MTHSKTPQEYTNTGWVGMGWDGLGWVGMGWCGLVWVEMDGHEWGSVGMGVGDQLHEWGWVIRWVLGETVVANRLFCLPSSFIFLRDSLWMGLGSFWDQIAFRLGIMAPN